MASAYLLKTEPTEYSFADLVKDKETVWDGVSNPVAVRNLREMQPGAKLIIYETAIIRARWEPRRCCPLMRKMQRTRR